MNQYFFKASITTGNSVSTGEFDDLDTATQWINDKCIGMSKKTYVDGSWEVVINDTTSVVCIEELCFVGLVDFKL